MASAASTPMARAIAVATTVVRSETPMAASGSMPRSMPGRTSARPRLRQPPSE